MIAPPGAAKRRSGGAFDRFREELSQPLFRNGHALILSSFATATIGFVYWVLAARGYNPSVVGRNAVALTTMSFLGGIAQCNLASALIRFIPSSGRSLRRFILGCYGFSVVVSVVLAGLFFLVLPTVAPSLEFLRDDHALILWFIVSAAAQAIFVLEDGVLTGLRRAPVVPLENASFSVVKAILVVTIAAIRPETGIFLSWTIATILTIVPINVYLFARAIPRHMRMHPDGGVSLRELLRFVPYDYGASLFWIAGVTLLPLVVIADAGAAAAATFNFAWVITYSLYLVSLNLGSSFVVEAAADESDLAASCKQVMAHLAKLLIPASILIAIGAPLIMAIFGHGYTSAGAPTLRLLAISAPPFIVSSTLQSALRVMRRTRAVFAIDASLCIVAIGISWALMPHLGIIAAGIGWCVGQYLVAATLGVILLLNHRQRAAALSSTRPAKGAGSTTPRWARLFGSGGARPALGERRAALLLGELRPAILAELATTWPGGVGLAGFDLVAVAPSPGGTSCAGLVRSQGWPAALVQVACNHEESAGLRSAQATLAALFADERLGDWRDLLPVRSVGSVGVRVFSVEVLSGGVDAETLLGGAPFLWRAVARRGLDALGELHERGRYSGAVGSPESLEARVTGTLQRIRQRIVAGATAPATLAVRLDGLERRLLSAVAEAGDEPRAWTHGHLLPSLVRLTPEAGMVTGLRGFERARADGLPALDAVGFVLRLVALVRRRPLADLVGEICAGGPLQSEVTALLSGVLDGSRLGACELALWCWAEEVAGGPGMTEPAAPARRDLAPVLENLERAS